MEQPAPTIVSQPTSFALPLSPSKYRPFGTELNGAVAYPHEDPRTRLEDVLKRSVTVVFWYKPDYPPIRLHGEVVTFPLFQLSQFAHLAADLGLAPAAYVDAFNPQACAWEQQTVSAVRAVESEQRLLFRVRKSLLEGLEDSECPGLAEEIRLQPSPPQKQDAAALNKRPAPDSLAGMLMGPPVKYSRIGSSPVPSPTPSACSTPEPSPKPAPPSIPAPFVSVDPIGASASSSAGATELTFQMLPLVKRWPNDFTVFELSAGFRQMDLLIAGQPSMTQRTAFERVFNCRYVKSTVCRHRGVWKRAPKELRETYERMGQDERGLWSEFIKRIEGGTGRTDSMGRKRQLGATTGADGHMTVVMAPQMTGAKSGTVNGPIERPVMNSLIPPPNEERPVMNSLAPPPPDEEGDSASSQDRDSKGSDVRGTSADSTSIDP